MSFSETKSEHLKLKVSLKLFSNCNCGKDFRMKKTHRILCNKEKGTPLSCSSTRMLFTRKTIPFRQKKNVHFGIKTSLMDLFLDSWNYHQTSTSRFLNSLQSIFISVIYNVTMRQHNMIWNSQSMIQTQFDR